MITMIGNTYGQYPPPAGEEGSTAIHADSNIFIDWADNVNIQRGWVNISDQSLGVATYGSDTSAIGEANSTVVSLGDAGIATLTFNTPIADGNGWDFAVFENSFSDTFLELAFVEVSSDGINFFRFTSVSLTQDSIQVATFGETNASHINNLAGKYKAFYGVPFDLSELKGIEGLDVNNITHVKVIDVVGSIIPEYGSVDSEGNIVNDPWPTPFESSGFDLDGIGVINNRDNTWISDKIVYDPHLIYPNPSSDFITIKTSSSEVEIIIYDMMGKEMLRTKTSIKEKVGIQELPDGKYIIVIKDDEKHNSSSFIKL